MSETPRFFLITPPVADAAAFAPLLEAALDAADVACVLLRTAARDEGATKPIVRALAPLVQQREAALLLPDDPRLAARVEADGVHLARPGPKLDEALDAFRNRRIVGVGGLRDRDDAMLAGESGADYLMFGGPDEPTSQDGILERVAWWAAIFNVPCVGYAVTPADAIAVAQAGAEFIALCDGLWTTPDEVAATMARLAIDVAARAARVGENAS